MLGYKLRTLDHECPPITTRSGLQNEKIFRLANIVTRQLKQMKVLYFSVALLV